MDASDLYAPEFRKSGKGWGLPVIIPVGSIEQHGAHLPITTDSDIVTEIASRLAKKCGFIVFPTISYGVSFEHRPLFNISIQSRNLRGFLGDIFESCWGAHEIIFLNGHHGNVESLNKLRNTMNRQYMLKHRRSDWNWIRCYSYWHFMEHEFDHAGFVETSIMLAISDKVKMEKAQKGLITKGLSDEEIQRINKLSTQPFGFPKVAKNGVWGDPTNATKKDGQKFLSEIVRNLAKECQS